ncbi:hypothetical protein [Paenirhodobacter sp. CAU 1674]|uniref:hypothetical protein n=1 Tax=Paenirhodobacter sp. CAU 1674 TaxID=3032596 RepID=UPI0023DBC70D|nr:hypothetical protein [Paenirhodobacter sp. CAU 1674]MDF2142918.1 hypothetical protein [Paenirhodobacter sp. CAU 1674]
MANTAVTSARLMPAEIIYALPGLSLLFPVSLAGCCAIFAVVWTLVRLIGGFALALKEQPIRAAGAIGFVARQFPLWGSGLLWDHG